MPMYWAQNLHWDHSPLQPRRITLPDSLSSCTGPTRTPKASQRSKRPRSFSKLSRWPFFLPSEKKHILRYFRPVEVVGIPNPLNKMSSSVGIMTFPTEWKHIKWSKPPACKGTAVNIDCLKKLWSESRVDGSTIMIDHTNIKYPKTIVTACNKMNRSNFNAIVM